ncbi:MAG TPA: hypothetical protein VFD54_06090 [Anaerolineales bacterium]|jgi:hypothetical protein|nr:hypothetical protein [Anaerolineales bacterium]
MASDRVGVWVDLICELPLQEQATCMLIGARTCLPVWQNWARHQGISDQSEVLIEYFNRWLSHQAKSEELDDVANAFLQTLPSDLRKVADPTGGYAGYALHTVAMIALGKYEDVHSDMFYTGVLYSAAAFCGVGHEAVWATEERLTEKELQFVRNWWDECCKNFSGLAEKYKKLVISKDNT